MMAVVKMMAAEDSGSRQQWQRQQMMAADDDGTRDRAADYNGEGQEQAENNDGIRHQTEKMMLFLAGVIWIIPAWKP
jgi:hypothetical protein